MPKKIYYLLKLRRIRKKRKERKTEEKTCTVMQVKDKIYYQTKSGHESYPSFVQLKHYAASMVVFVVRVVSEGNNTAVPPGVVGNMGLVGVAVLNKTSGVKPCAEESFGDGHSIRRGGLGVDVDVDDAGTISSSLLLSSSFE